MKWVNFDDEIKLRPGEDKYFKDLNTPPLPPHIKSLSYDKIVKRKKETLKKEGFKLLVRHDSKKSNKKFKCDSDSARRKYEIFCGGFLYFYDNELGNYAGKSKLGKKNKNAAEGLAAYLRSKGFMSGKKDGRLKMNHAIAFIWGQDGTWVEVYLNPPQTKNPDPPSTPSPPPPETSPT